MALASHSEPITRISGRMFGRMWPATMRVSEKPSARPAMTNSRSLIAIVGARAMRANGGIDVSAMAMMMLCIDGPSIATRIKPEDQRRKREQHVHRLHGDGVDAAAVPAGEHADRRADQHREQRRGDADDERDARAVEDARQRVATEAVGAEPVLGARRPQLLHDVLVVGIVRREHRRGERERDDDDERRGARSTTSCWC